MFRVSSLNFKFRVWISSFEFEFQVSSFELIFQVSSLNFEFRVRISSFELMFRVSSLNFKFRVRISSFECYNISSITPTIIITWSSGSVLLEVAVKEWYVDWFVSITGSLTSNLLVLGRYNISSIALTTFIVTRSSGSVLITKVHSRTLKRQWHEIQRFDQN